MLKWLPRGCDVARTRWQSQLVRGRPRVADEANNPVLRSCQSQSSKDLVVIPIFVRVQNVQFGVHVLNFCFINGIRRIRPF